jgi:serine phosphatase RsbU (regulator of sigma subunit)
VISALLPGEMATAVVAELDPETGEVAIASAGHLPALHATATGTDYVREGRGPALGVLDDVGYPEARLQLAGDDRLLLFSDGLVERRGGPTLTDGLDALREAVALAPTDPHELLDAVLEAMHPQGLDDVTLVGIART